MEHSVRKASVGVAAKTLLPFCYLERILLKWAWLLLFHFHLQPFNFRLCCLHMSVKLISLIFVSQFYHWFNKTWQIVAIWHIFLLQGCTPQAAATSCTTIFCPIQRRRTWQDGIETSLAVREHPADCGAFCWSSFEPDRAKRWEGMTWSFCYLAQIQLCFSAVSMYLRWIVIWRRSAPGWVLGERKCSVNEIKTMFTERRHPFQRNSHGPDRLQICFHVSSRAGWWHLPTLFTQTGEWDFLTSIQAVARKQICSILT